MTEVFDLSLDQLVPRPQEFLVLSEVVPLGCRPCCLLLCVSGGGAGAYMIVITLHHKTI